MTTCSATPPAGWQSARHQPLGQLRAGERTVGGESLLDDADGTICRVA